MRPTAMQKSLDKEAGKSKINPPPVLPKHSTTVTVVCNGGEKSPSSLILASHAEGQSFPDDGDVLNSNNRNYKSLVTVGESRRKQTSNWSIHETTVINTSSTAVKSQSSPASSTSSVTSSLAQPPVSVKSQEGFMLNLLTSSPSMPSLKLAPPVFPRSKSVGSIANSGGITVIINANGHYSSSGSDGDFISSLPNHSSTQPSLQQYSLPSLVGTSEQSVVSVQASSPSPSLDTASTIERKAASTTITVNSATSARGLQAVPSQSIKSACWDSERPLTTARKAIVSRPPSMTGIAENGSFIEKEDSTDDRDAATFPKEVFYMNMKAWNGVSTSPGKADEEPTFVGRRDVKDLNSLQEKQIVSCKGTVRGFKNRVRAGIVTFVQQPFKKIYEEVSLNTAANVFNYREVEKGKIVMYTTSMTVVRETYDRCKTSRNILQNHMVRYEERDLYMNPENQRELNERLETEEELQLPQIFMGGSHLGGSTDLEKLNETGELRKLLQTFPKIQVRSMCDNCGGYRFIPCVVCHGSKKSVHRNNFTEEFCALRCMHCDDNGLQRCKDCIDQQE